MNPLPMVQLSEEALREKEAKYCSQGDTVHYSPVPKFFQNCEGGEAEGPREPPLPLRPRE